MELKIQRKIQAVLCCIFYIEGTNNSNLVFNSRISKEQRSISGM
jgi:hypothetical protein